MLVSCLKLKNWRNFQRIDEIPLRQRQFIVGPNASGKSNLLDVFRFLRDIAKSEGGGLQKAVSDRGGISKIRDIKLISNEEFPQGDCRQTGLGLWIKIPALRHG